MHRRQRSPAIIIAIAFLVGASVFALTPLTAWGATLVQQDGARYWTARRAGIQFAVDGDLLVERLHWSHWGAATTIATGVIYERGCEVRTPNRPNLYVPGSVILSRLRRCRGTEYYTHAVVHTSRHLYFPANPLPRLTPCNYPARA